MAEDRTVVEKIPESSNITIQPGDAALHFLEGRVTMYAPGMEEGALMTFQETIASGVFLLVRNQHPALQGLINDALNKAGAGVADEIGDNESKDNEGG